MAGVAEQVAGEIQRSLDFYAGTAAETKFSKVYLSGGTAKIPALFKTIEARVGVPVEIANPFKNVVIDSRRFDPGFIMDVAPPVDRAALVRRGATPWAPPSSTGRLALRCSAYFSPSLRYASKALRHAANNVRQFGRRSSDLGVAELGLDVADPRLHEALLLLGRVVFGVLLEIAMGARRRNRLRDLRPLLVLQAAKLFLEFCRAARGQRHLAQTDASACRSWSRFTPTLSMWSIASQVAFAAARLV